MYIESEFIKNNLLPENIEIKACSLSNYAIYYPKPPSTLIRDIPSYKTSEIIKRYHKNSDIDHDSNSHRYVSVLLNPDNWSNFVDYGIEECIAGPTLELYAQSYNAKNGQKINLNFVKGSGYTLNNTSYVNLTSTDWIYCWNSSGNGLSYWDLPTEQYGYGVSAAGVYPGSTGNYNLYSSYGGGATSPTNSGAGLRLLARTSHEAPIRKSDRKMGNK